MEAVDERKRTDERLDDLNHRVDDGFRRMDERFAQIDARFTQVDRRFDELHRLMWHGFIALVGFQLTGFAAILGFIAART
ncbi:MAG: hypothetical protein ACOYD4_09260 [Solirubrobacterales bacterium]